MAVRLYQCLLFCSNRSCNKDNSDQVHCCSVGQLSNSDLAKSAAVPVVGLEGGHLARLLVLLHQDGLRGEGGEDRTVVIRVLHQNQHLSSKVSQKFEPKNFQSGPKKSPQAKGHT